MAFSYFSDGSMIARTAKRAIDERSEDRHSPLSSTAVLEFRGSKHVVRLINLSPSGAMVLFSRMPNIGERLALQLLDRGTVWTQVRWVRDGRVGLSFAAPLA